ncbi:MAG TPA: ATPase, T2SS/T4P/T4SS family [Nitrospira sp.]|nr:ATPase, T2SS/T4P/T4SS family [Nitrospira sp.]
MRVPVRAHVLNLTIDRIGPTDFPRFREFLIKQTDLPSEKATTLSKTTPVKLYLAGTIVGLDEVQIAKALAEFLWLPYVEHVRPDELQLDVLSPSFCLMHGLIPLQNTDGRRRFVLSNPFNWEIMDAIARCATSAQVVQLLVTTPNTVTTTLKAHGLIGKLAGKSLAESTKAQLFDMLETVTPQGEAEEGLVDEDEYEILSSEQMQQMGHLPPVVRLVNLFLTDAVNRGASDIHIEPHETLLQVRYRLDGVLVDAMKIPKAMQAPTISRLKIIANLDIAEHRKPQDGRSRLRLQDRRIDLRVSSLPSQFGEKVVIRLLDSAMNLAHLDRLNMEENLLRRFKLSLSSPQGIVLVTGPTGSGKTTTLYAVLNHLKTPAKNIITVENPIEYQMTGMTQVQIEPKAGLTFATGLRSILRQDPNIIMVGEIRDHETAEIAMEVSQTGHFLLSTVHTNDSAGTVIRLIDLGIEPFQVAASLVGILAQRLVRKVCVLCTVDRAPSAEALEQLRGRVPLPDIASWKAGAGCAHCQHSGYKGRLGIHEFLDVTDEIRDLITKRASDQVIRGAARAGGMRSLLEDGIAKAAAGLTTLEEVLRVAPQYDTKTSGADKQVSSPISKTSPSDVPTILIIDDEEDTRAIIEFLLKKSGYHTITVADGIEALLAMGSRTFDLILSDINMPNLNGLQLLELSNQKGLKTPVIFLTGDGNKEYEQKCLELGAVDYITKPIKNEVVQLRVKRAIGK